MPLLSQFGSEHSYSPSVRYKLKLRQKTLRLSRAVASQIQSSPYPARTDLALRAALVQLWSNTAELRMREAESWDAAESPRILLCSLQSA